jgi:large-conductance mechanosensitive channel
MATQIIGTILLTVLVFITIKELHKMYNKANTKHGEATAPSPEQDYQMGVMDTIEDVQDFINNLKNTSSL